MQMAINHFKYTLGLSTILMLCSCSGTKPPSLLVHLHKSNCNQENTYNYSKNDIPLPINQLQIDTALTARFNLKDLNIANAIGVLDLLSAYIQKSKELKANNSLQGQIDLINIRQKINHQIDLTSLEISSVAAELDCEEERINQIASYLKESESKKETKLTVASIILGSMTAIVTGILVSTKDESDAADLIGVAVGVADAALGIMILNNHRQIEFNHPRNVLKEIWLATETSTVYPPSIWYYLNYSKPEKNEEASLREQLIENWKAFGQVESKGKSKKDDFDIYFSEGGMYTTDQLENRANMYDQIESLIKLMKQDLRNLSVNLKLLK